MPDQTGSREESLYYQKSCEQSPLEAEERILVPNHEELFLPKCLMCLSDNLIMKKLKLIDDGMLNGKQHSVRIIHVRSSGNRLIQITWTELA